MNRKDLPIAWVAHQGTVVFGTAALRTHDLDDRKDLSPWLGGVFVLPAFRRRGIASALCSAVERHAANRGIRKLFLFTLDQQALYEPLGWRKMEDITWEGFGGVVMTKVMVDGVPP